MFGMFALSKETISKYAARVALSVAACVAALSLSPPSIAAQQPEPIEIISSGAVSEFPTGMRFSIEVEGENDISEIAVKLRTGTNRRESYDYMDFESAQVVGAEMFWRTDTRPRYVPPGTIISYYFEVRDSQDNTLRTDVEEFIYEDVRFTWDEVSEGPVAVAYHGPVKTRAEIVLEAIVDTLNFMGPLLGAETTGPIRVTMYNNVKEMLEALPPGSATIRRELITEGQAFTNIGTLLVLGGDRGARGTASHEVTHILTHRAGDSAAARVPAWLDEGLAEFGNVEPGFSYDIALEFAIATDRLLPITSMPGLPGDPEDVIIFYGQASSLIEYMVFTYGPNAMRDLLAMLGDGEYMDDALPAVYGRTRLELENEWRESIGAPAYVPLDRESLKPTPIPRPVLGLYTLTPQAGSDTLASVEPTPTPTPIPTSTPPPTTAPEPTATATVAPPPTPSESGSGCAAPTDGAMGVSDLAVGMFALGIVGLAARRRRG